MRALILVAIVAWATLAAADEMLVREVGDVRLRYHSADERKIGQVVAEVEDARQRFRDELGIDFREPVDIVLARGRDEFRSWAGENIPGWALAIAHTQKRGIVVDVSLTGPLLDNNLLLTMRHELCHLALGQVEKESRQQFPLWFHEGVAVRVTGFRHFNVQNTFDVVAAHGKLIRLEKLADSFPARADEAEMAYLESENFTNFLAERCHGSLIPLIAEFGKGVGFANAVENAAGAPLADIERQWRDSLKVPHPWVFTLWRALSLFVVLAFCTMIAYVIVRMRNRRLKEIWNREEADYGESEEDEEEVDDEDFEEDDYEDEDEWSA